MNHAAARVAGGLAVLGGALALLAARYGLFHKVTWDEGSMEAITFVYVEQVGPYKSVGKAFEKLVTALKEKGIAVRIHQDRFVGAYAVYRTFLPFNNATLMKCRSLA
jgi:hypothetical protein